MLHASQDGPFDQRGFFEMVRTIVSNKNTPIDFLQSLLTNIVGFLGATHGDLGPLKNDLMMVCRYFKTQAVQPQHRSCKTAVATIIPIFWPSCNLLSCCTTFLGETFVGWYHGEKNNPVLICQSWILKRWAKSTGMCVKSAACPMQMLSIVTTTVDGFILCKMYPHVLPKGLSLSSSSWVNQFLQVLRNLQKNSCKNFWGVSEWLLRFREAHIPLLQPPALLDLMQWGGVGVRHASHAAVIICYVTSPSSSFNILDCQFCTLVIFSKIEEEQCTMCLFWEDFLGLKPWFPYCKEVFFSRRCPTTI